MIQTLINWAEIIGGLAIVISLIFVAIQIRSSVIQSRADSYTQSFRTVVEFHVCDRVK